MWTHGSDQCRASPGTFPKPPEGPSVDLPPLEVAIGVAGTRKPGPACPPAHALGVSGHFAPCCVLGKGLYVSSCPLWSWWCREGEQRADAVLSGAIPGGGSCTLPFAGKEMHPRFPGVGEPLEGLG